MRHALPAVLLGCLIVPPAARRGQGPAQLVNSKGLDT